MKTAIKLALVGATLISTSAFANTLLPATTSVGQTGSDLILFVSDLTTGSYFAYDTGVSLDTVESIAGVAAAVTANGGVISQTAATGTLAYNGAGLNLGSVASFLASTAAGDNVQWAIDAGDAHTTSTNTIGGNRLLVSSALSAPSWAGSVTNAGAKAGVANLNSLIGAWNTAASGADTSTAAGWGKGTYGVIAQSGFIGSNPDSGAAVGSAEALFIASNGVTGGTSTANIQATSGTFTLNKNGTLTYNSGSTVVTPIPGAMWLLGSGLFGLVGVSRRRRV